MHQKQWHSLDLLYYELLKILIWFHPIVYLLQKELSATHEYLADQEVIKIADKSTYTNNLLNYLFDSDNIPFVNSFFNQSLLKKRIQMLSYTAQNNSNLKRYLLLLPITFGIVTISLYASFSNDPYVQDNYRYLNTYGEENTSTMPTIIGCPIRTGNCFTDLIKKHIKENLNPETKVQLHDLGPQMLIVSFWIEADGSVSDVQPFSSIKELSELARSGIASLPPISPALQKGKPTRTAQKYMIEFDISK